MQIGTEKKYTGMLRDISERKRMEATLRESEERFRQLAEHIDAVFWLTSPDKSEVLYVSPAFETIWEFPRDLLYVNPSVSGWITSIRRTVRASPPRRPVRCTFPMTRNIGSSHQADRCGGSGIEASRSRTPRGRPIALRASPWTSPAAKQMEAKIRASELRHRALVELSPTPSS
jgi:hypothetical protein